MNKYQLQDLIQRYSEEGCLVIDTETVGLKKPRHIVDIALVHFPSGKLVFESLIKPARKIDYYASLVHGIYENHLNNAPTFPQVWGKLFPIISKEKHILSYNVAFDYNVLLENVQYYGFEYKAEWECLMKMYKVYRGYDKPIALELACEEMNALKGTHRAKSDALAAARILYRMTKNYD